MEMNEETWNKMTYEERKDYDEKIQELSKRLEEREARQEQLRAELQRKKHKRSWRTKAPRNVASRKPVKR